MKTAVNDSVQNHPPVQFFIGASPSMASKIVSSAAGVMVSVNQLKSRKSDFQVGNWILDSGAFTEVARHGGYRYGVEEYHWQICRWSQCGSLLCAVSQDWMCEPFVLSRTGSTIEQHQKLTIDRYDALIRLNPPVPIMPVLQGYDSSDYLSHLQQYGSRLHPGQWVGVGSVCRRNGNPKEIANILKGIKLLRPDLRLHGFGLKILALENSTVKDLLYSCDSMAWSYPQKFSPAPDSVQNQIQLGQEYQAKIQSAVSDSVQKRVPVTAGAGNGQGRKPKWKAGKTKAIRVPEAFADQLIHLARKWDGEL